MAEKLNVHGIETKFLYLGVNPVAGCIACGKCSADGRCVFHDQVNSVLDQLDAYSGIVIGSPVYYAGPSGQLCAFLDRLFYCSRNRMAGKFGAAVVSCRRGGASSAFDRLNKYFTTSNMHVVSSQYWNQVHGVTPEDVRQDLEGMQTMRTLAENMVWLLKNAEAGQNNGIPKPQYEPQVATNFIK